MELMGYQVYPVTGGAGSNYWGTPVATAGSLPATGNTGEVRIALDTGIEYLWNGTAWVVYYDKSTFPTIPVNLATQVSGVLPIANGGTNSSTALANGFVLISNAGKLVESSTPTGKLTLINNLTSDAQAQLNARLPLAGGTMTGTLTLAGAPSGTLEAATKGYADLKLALAGGTLSGTLVLAADPVNPLEASTKSYVDSLRNGLRPKDPCLAGTVGNVTLSGVQTIDGVSLAIGDRVLVRAQTLSQNNGIYLVASGAWTRALDFDQWNAEIPGAQVVVEDGTTLADTGWYCTANPGGTLGTTPIAWAQAFGPGSILTDNLGISLVGNLLSLVLDGTTLSKSGTGLKVNAGGITNTEVSASAAIALTKLAALAFNFAVVTNASGQLVASATTATEVGYLSGTNSNIQAQLNALQAANAVTPISSNVTLVNKSLNIVSTAAARSLTMPAATLNNIVVIKAGATADVNNITLIPAGGAKIETVAGNYVITDPLSSTTLVADGTDWWIV